MSGKYVLIPLKTFQDLCSSSKKTGNKITGVIQNWANTDEASKSTTSKRKW